MFLNNTKKNFVPIKEGSVVIFYVNTAGFPLNPETFSQMWNFAKELHPEAIDVIDELQHKKEPFADVPCHSPPYNQITNHKLSNQEKTEKIQEYINKLHYNHTGMQFFDIRKERPIAGLMDIARKIIDECLPIKCLEAVILSIYLTNEINTLEKFSISFKTCSNKKVHRHVVLGLYCHKTGKFGTVGISRRSELSYKPLKFDTLSDLLNDFICTYAKFMHKVKRIRMGSPIPNVNRSYESIDWNCLNVFPVESNRDWIRQVEKHSRSIRLCNNYFTQSSSSNQKFNSEISLKTAKASTAYHKQNEFNKANDLQVELADKVLETVTIIDKPKLRSIRV